MKVQAFRFALILLSAFSPSTFISVSAAQFQDFSRLNLPDGAIARLGKGGVSYGDRGIAFSADGSRLAVAASIGIWIYDAETYDEIALLTGHEEEVSTVAFSPDGAKLASGSGFHLPGTLKIWEVETGQNIATIQAEKGSTRSLAFSPDGTKLAWADRLWDVRTEQQFDILQDKRLFKIAFSPVGKILAGTDANVAKRRRTAVINLYDIKTGQILNTLTAAPPSERISSIAFSPDGRMLASSSGRDGTVELWDVETGQIIAAFTERPSHRNAMCVVFSPDGTKLAVGSAEGIKLLEVPTGRHIYTQQHIDAGELELSVDVFSVAFSPDGTKLASTSWDGVKLWEVSTGRNLTTLRGHVRAVTAVAFSPDGLTLASNTVGGVQMWEVATGRQLAALAGPPSFAASFVYSPDGTRLATGSADAKRAEHTVKFWDVQTRQSLATLQGHIDLVTTVAYSQDGILLASGSKDKTIKVWAVETGKNMVTLHGHKKSINSVAFSPDGTKLASGSDDTAIRLWQIPTGKALYTLGGVNSPQVPVEVLPATRPDKNINELGIDDEAEIIRDGVQSVAFSPDGTILASASLDGVRLWNVGTGQLIAVLTGGTDSPGFSVKFSKDGTILASGSWTDTVELWDVSTRKHIASFPGHTGNVCAVAFSPNGAVLASGSHDGTGLLWKMPELIAD